MKRKRVPDFRLIISQTFFTITNLIDLGNSEIKFVLISNCSVRFSRLKKLFVCFCSIFSKAHGISCSHTWNFRLIKHSSHKDCPLYPMNLVRYCSHASWITIYKIYAKIFGSLLKNAAEKEKKKKTRSRWRLRCLRYPWSHHPAAFSGHYIV